LNRKGFKRGGDYLGKGKMLREKLGVGSSFRVGETIIQQLSYFGQSERKKQEEGWGGALSMGKKGGGICRNISRHSG